LSATGSAPHQGCAAHFLRIHSGWGLSLLVAGGVVGASSPGRQRDSKPSSRYRGFQ